MNGQTFLLLTSSSYCSCNQLLEIGFSHCMPFLLILGYTINTIVVYLLCFPVFFLLIITVVNSYYKYIKIINCYLIIMEIYIHITLLIALSLDTLNSFNKTPQRFVVKTRPFRYKSSWSETIQKKNRAFVNIIRR